MLMPVCIVASAHSCEFTFLAANARDTRHSSDTHERQMAVVSLVL